MEKFLGELDRQQQSVQTQRNHNCSPLVKIDIINKRKEESKRSMVQALLTKLYKQSLPFNDEYKATYDAELGEQFQSFMKPYCKDGSVYEYIISAKKHGCKPAEMLLESVDNAVERHFYTFLENVNTVDPDDIKMDDSIKENEMNTISLNLDYDQISNIIMNNVKTTVKHERELVEQEDAKIKEIETALSENPEMVTESAIDIELKRHGLRGKVYTPTLFNGIMINKLTSFTESGEGMDELTLQQLAFTESVKEYTGLSVLSTLGLEKISGSRYTNLAYQYARCKS